MLVLACCPACHFFLSYTSSWIIVSLWLAYIFFFMLNSCFPVIILVLYSIIRQHCWILMSDWLERRWLVFYNRSSDNSSGCKVYIFALILICYHFFSSNTIVCIHYAVNCMSDTQHKLIYFLILLIWRLFLEGDIYLVLCNSQG